MYITPQIVPTYKAAGSLSASSGGLFGTQSAGAEWWVLWWRLANVSKWLCIVAAVLFLLPRVLSKAFNRVNGGKKSKKSRNSSGQSLGRKVASGSSPKSSSSKSPRSSSPEGSRNGSGGGNGASASDAVPRFVASRRRTSTMQGVQGNGVQGIDQPHHRTRPSSSPPGSPRSSSPKRSASPDGGSGGGGSSGGSSGRRGRTGSVIQTAGARQSNNDPRRRSVIVNNPGARLL
jgi:hypothetical protein